MSYRIKLWAYGLGAAVISSAAGAVTIVVVDPDHFNFHDGLTHLLMVAGALALVAFFNYLQKHPLPEWDGVTERRDNNKGDGQ